MDSTFFDAYNKCDMNMQAQIYADTLEFYHDKGGLMTSKQDILDGTKKNICGKVTRELVAGSIEVYPIKDFGAVEIGLHKFHNNQEPANTPSTISKFIIMWQFANNKWQITKVISLH
ncbi:nuclear transport factor 2 family protein [Flavobacterium sp. F-380]|uniref:Nuclear transport factor 2 family protein n=2 Tax=Flavobacterium kayseriense TaxID=2764714 RepID=A0ABR7JA01_9FLAO|nr:nuclear transport factor 2 family protein [Flavobacterium kayseriense]MBC5848889.1 nuclear transport factor 2 family protein [Flavobacterium kayseriense]